MILPDAERCVKAASRIPQPMYTHIILVVGPDSGASNSEENKEPTTQPSKKGQAEGSEGRTRALHR